MGCDEPYIMLADQWPGTETEPTLQPPSYDAPQKKRGTNRRLIVGIILGCGGLCLVIAVIGLVAGGAFVRWLVEKPENINVDVNVPLLVSKGEPFAVVVTIENLIKESRLLDSIDIDDKYLEGIALTGAEPPFIESYPLSFLDQHSYTFEQEIPPTGILVVELNAIAVRTGDFSGQIDVCIDSASNCLPFAMRTVVE
jgi:hypothetical protein